MAFWINIYGCQPYPWSSKCKSAQKPKLLLGTVVYTKLCSSVQWHGARLQPDRGEAQIIAFTKEKEDNMLL